MSLRSAPAPLTNQSRGTITNDRRRCVVSMATRRRFGVIQAHAQRPSRVVRLNQPISHQPGIAAPAILHRSRRRASLAERYLVETISALAMRTSLWVSPSSALRRSSLSVNPDSSSVAVDATASLRTALVAREDEAFLVDA